MDRLLRELLEELDGYYPNNVTIRELLEHGFTKKLILESLDKKLLDYPFEMSHRRISEAEANDSLFVILGENGLLMLNQMRLKEETAKLNQSINKFDKSSKQSSWIMIGLTAILIILTLLLSWLTLVGILK
jgi:hypothetical protein